MGEAIDIGPVAIFLSDDDGRYVAVNRYACELLGYTREELLALSVSDVATDGADGNSGKTHLACKDGSLVEVTYRAAPTSVARMPLSVSVAWPDGASAAPQPRRRSAPGRD